MFYELVHSLKRLCEVETVSFLDNLEGLLYWADSRVDLAVIDVVYNSHRRQRVPGQVVFE